MSSDAGMSLGTAGWSFSDAGRNLEMAVLSSEVSPDALSAAIQIPLASKKARIVTKNRPHVCCLSSQQSALQARRPFNRLG